MKSAHGLAPAVGAEVTLLLETQRIGELEGALIALGASVVAVFVTAWYVGRRQAKRQAEADEIAREAGRESERVPFFDP